MRTRVRAECHAQAQYGYPKSPSEETTPLTTEDSNSEAEEEFNLSTNNAQSVQLNEANKQPSTGDVQEVESGSSCTSVTTPATSTRSGRNVRKRSVWDPSGSEEAGPSTSRGTKRAKRKPSLVKKKPVQIATKPNKQTRRSPAKQSMLQTTDTIDSSSEFSESSKLTAASKPEKKASTKLAASKANVTKAVPVSPEGRAESEDSNQTASTSTGNSAATTTKVFVPSDTQLKDLYSNLQRWKLTLNKAQVPELSKTKEATSSSSVQSQPSSSADKAKPVYDQINPIKVINNFFDFQMEDSREDFEWLEAQLLVNGERSMAVNNTMIHVQEEGMTNAKHVQLWFATLLVLRMTKRISGSEYASGKQRLLAFMSAESRSVSHSAMDNHFLAQNLYEAFYFVVSKLVDLAQKWMAEYMQVRPTNCQGTPLERIRAMWDSCWTDLVHFTTEIIGRMPKYPRGSDNSVSFSTLFLFTIFVAKFWYGQLLISNVIVPVNSNEPAQSELNHQFDPSVSAVTKLASFLLQSPVYSDTNEAIPEIARLLYRLVIYKEDGKLVLTSGQALDLVQQLVVVVPSCDKTAHFLPHLFYIGYATLRYHLLFDNGAMNQLGRFERLDSELMDTWGPVLRKMQVPLVVRGANNMSAQWNTMASTAAIDAIIRLFNAVFAKYIANCERIETWESNEFDKMLSYFSTIRRPEQFQALSTLCSIRQIISEAVSSP